MIEETKTQGTVEHVSLRNRGIKVNGEWFNWQPTLDKFCQTIQKGELTEITSSGKNILSIIRIPNKTEERVYNKKVQHIKTIITTNPGLLDDQFNMFAQERDVFATTSSQYILESEIKGLNTVFHKLTVFYWEEKT